MSYEAGRHRRRTYSTLITLSQDYTLGFVPMAKRKKNDLDDGHYSDETFEPKAKKKISNTVNKTRQRSTKKRLVQSSDDEFSGGSSDPGLTVISSPHAPSLHVVSEPIFMGKSLLEWFAGVRETRSMPWRKPYNPDHSPEERAQRAYEVL